ncbi:MAG: repeat containing protein, partial [Verrucomicrobiaceae bacterium]|nr:repeat containing protein [Verrucomicrobiaceae bacterium]
MGLALAVHAEPNVLGTYILAEGRAVGSDSVMLAVTSPNGSWTATANDGWLHVSTSSGVGSGIVAFTFDANTGATRSGTITIASQTLTVTQAGSTYVSANPLTILAKGLLSAPSGVSLDSAGNVYIADSGGNAIRKWTVLTQELTTLVSTGLNFPTSTAVDSSGNVYISDFSNNLIKKWSAAT